jgi:hypothetical protein
MAFTCLNPDQAVKVEVSYVQPTFAVSYLDVNICAAVTFPDVLGVEVITPTDLVTLATTKVLADATNGFSDSVTRTFTKGLFDSQILNDLAVIGDIQPHIDVVDTSSPADSITGVVFAKYIADAFSLVDSAVAVKLYERSFSDSFSVPDVPYKSILPGTEVDAATVSDNSSRGVDKNLAEALTLIDNMDGDIEYLFFKATSDLISQTDAQAVVFAPNKSDNAVLSSSGILSMQDYCDITYFLEDYVGVSRTFT